jgi:plastocyanin
MPIPGRRILLAAALAGAALGAVPALGAKHRRHGRVVVLKGHKRGHVPASLPRRAPLTGTVQTPTGPVSTGTDTPPGPTPPPPPACPTAVGVSEGEWFTTPSRTSLCAGKKVTWELDNVGMDDHNLTVVDLGTGTVVGTWDIVHPGAQAAKSLTLPAGTYRLFCTLSSDGSSHDALGMNAILTVG